VRRRYGYLLYLGATVAAVVVATAAFNVLVDPYGYFDRPRIAGFNAVRPNPTHDAVPIKRVAMCRLRPDALILGNSRAEVGFDPENPAFRARGLKAYNAAVRGSNIKTAWNLLSSCPEAPPPKVMLLGLEFLDFLVDSQVAPRRPSPPDEETVVAAAKRMFGAVTTIQALQDSVRTIALQVDRYPDELTDRGFTPLRNYERIAQTEGSRAMFQQRAEENARSLLRRPRELFAAGTRTSTEFEFLRAIAERAREGGTELHLIIYPYHAQLLFMFEQAGLWALFEQWKRQLAEIATESDGAVVLWDFSGFSDYSTEAIPLARDTRSPVRWYWEAGHFKKPLGDVILEEVLSAAGGKAARGLGKRLNEKNVDEEIERARRGRDEFVRQNGALVAEIRALMNRARQLDVRP
jgi:hypothetical protein